jgi:hypothetical protein
MEMTAKIIRLTPFLTDACVSTVAFIFVFLSCCIYRGSGSLPDGPARGPETQRFTVSCKKRKKRNNFYFILIPPAFLFKFFTCHLGPGRQGRMPY